MIYCDEGCKNIWMAGHNEHGHCATNSFKSVRYDESDVINSVIVFTNKGMRIKKMCTNILDC